MSKAKVRKRQAKRQMRKHRHSHKKKSTALAVAQPVAIQRPQKRELFPEEVALLQRTVAKGTSPDEFALFLWVARKHGLDPMTRQLHAVMRWSTELNCKVMSIQVGIDGYRALAARHHPDYGGADEPEFEFQDGVDLQGKPAKILYLARVRVWKKGFEHPTVGVAYWDEYHPDLAKPESFMWRRMPKGQLAKCAEALALRKAYPDLSNIYVDEEMHRADDNFSPSGRAITVGGQPPSLTRETQTPEYRSQFSQPRDVPASESAGAASPRHTPNPDAAPAPLPGKGKKVTIRWPSDASEVAHVLGDLAELIPFIEQKCYGIFLDTTAKCWAIPAEAVHVLQEQVVVWGYDYQEVSGSPSPAGTPPSVEGAASTAAKRPEPTAKGASASSGAGDNRSPASAVAVIQAVKTKKGDGSPLLTNKNEPFVSVVTATKTYYCFNAAIFGFLSEGTKQEAEFVVKDEKTKYPKIVGLKRIGKRLFDDDLVTPIVSRDEHVGASLFK